MCTSDAICLAYAVLVLVCAMACGLPTTVLPERGDYRGCRSFAQTEPATSNTVAAGDVNGCMDWCEEHYFRFASLTPNACDCLNNLTASTHALQLPPDDCDARCSGPPSTADLRCGSNANPLRRSIYDAGLRLPGAVQALSAHQITNTTVTLVWQASPHPDLVRSYRINGTIVRTYANRTLPPPPEWTVPAAEMHMDAFDLRPGTVYNFTVLSVGDGGAGDAGLPGGARSLVVRTPIGWPEPEPPQPRILGAGTAHTRTVDLPVVQNTMGPVTRVRVVVVFEDASLVRQDFEAGRVMGYARAQEEGLNYYIAAELEPYARNRRFTVGDGRTYQGYVNEPLPEGAHVHVLLGVVSTEVVDDDGAPTDASGTERTLVRYSASSHEQHDGMPDGNGGGGGDGGRVAESTTQYDASDESSHTLLIALVVACTLFGLLLVASIVVYVVLRIRMDRRLGMRRQPYDQHEMHRPNYGGRSRENNGYVGDHGGGSNERKLEDMLRNNLLEHQKVARNDMKLNVYNVLGSGHFGDVISGVLMGAEVKVHVISDDLEPLQHSHFLNDLDDVLRMEPHSNMLRFIGVCQTPDWTYIVFEGTRSTLKKRLIDGRSMQDATRFTATSEEFVLRVLFNVADAMEFIVKQGFRHRNLCAFSVCITVDDDVRLVTFASTPFDEHANRVDMSRWSAPEMLRFKNCTKRSDVWSFGCLMWESCTLGGTLYPEISTADLADRIKAGARPERCALFFDDIYQLMLNCWQMEQSDRPSFRDVADTLRDLLSSPRHVLSFDRRDGVLLPLHLPLLELENEAAEPAGTLHSQAAQPILGGGPRP